MLAFSAFFVLIILSSYSCNLVVVSSLNDEGTALLSFKHSIEKDPQGSLTNWNASDETPCLWNGITCKDQTVVSVTIPKKHLSGLLSPSLGSLSNLRHLNLRNNNFSGTLPSHLFNPPGLQSLVLSGNSLSGNLPFEIRNLDYLQTLDISRNFFVGSLPDSLLHCKRLRNLELSHNNFSALPVGFGKNFALLEKLDVSFNHFGGSIPSDLGYLSNLEGTLDLSHNMFNGSIPDTLGNLPEKVYIDLTFNNLSGKIPQTGALMNRGPTAFIGNPGLCGTPLKNLCTNQSEASPPSSYPYLPSNYPPLDGGGGRRLTKSAVIAIIVGDVIGICVIGLLFSYCYSRICYCGKRNHENGHGFDYEKQRKAKKECLCFNRDESETLSENLEQYDLVPLDAQVGFDLDKLLKASAFVLGKSGIGIVYKVVLDDGLTLAVRRLGEGGSQRYKEFQTEVEAIGKLSHPNIVTLRAYYWSVDEKLLIYDFIPNGDLATAIHGKPGSGSFTLLSWSIRLKIMKGVAQGLVCLHELSPKKYVHGDLKPSNILLGQDMEPKISDFGLGRLANIAGQSPNLQSKRMVSERGPQSSSASEVVTFAPASCFGSYYQAPEALKLGKPSQKWDIYSYGVILLEMVTGRPAVVHVASSEMSLVQWMRLCIEEKKAVSEVLDPNLAADAEREEEMISVLKMAMACTHNSPDRRPSMRHVLEALDRL